jgi:hypothetical protein
MSALIRKLACCFLIAYPQWIFATVFVMIKTPQGWVVGGDSLRGYSQTGIYEKDCKMREHHGIILVVWGSAGWKAADNGSPDLRGISQGFLDDPRGGTAKERNIKLREFIERDNAFLDDLKKAVALTSVPALFGWAFVDSNGPYGTQYLNGTYQPIDGEKGVYAALCAVDAALPYLHDHLFAPPTVDQATSIARGALEAQARSTPAFVGPPYSIILVSSPGVRWIDPGPCQTHGSHPDAK